MSDIVPRMNKLIKDFYSLVPHEELANWPNGFDWKHLKQMTPRYNLVDCGDHFEYNFDVPGVNKEDIVINEKDGVLTVTGKRENKYVDKHDGYSYSETHHGEFTRSVKLDDKCALESLSASLTDGVLKVTVAKNTSSGKDDSRKIAIN